MDSGIRVSQILEALYAPFGVSENWRACCKSPRSTSGSFGASCAATTSSGLRCVRTSTCRRDRLPHASRRWPGHLRNGSCGFAAGLSPRGAHGPHVGIYAVESTPVTRVRRRSPRGSAISNETPEAAGTAGEEDRHGAKDLLDRKLRDRCGESGRRRRGSGRVYGKIKSHLACDASQRRL